MALTADQPSPTPVDTTGAMPDTWTAISVVGQHACAIGADATAWCWGGDSEGELGNGDALTPHQASPTPVDTTGAIPDTWLAINASKQGTTLHRRRRHSMVLGDRLSGLLGNGAALTDEQPSPSPVNKAGAIPDTWQAITVGTSACAIATDGSAWCWGFDANGSLGTAPLTDAQHSPSPVDTAGSIPDTWQAISAGFHVCGRGADGTVWCWGDDGNGLGNGPGLTADQHSPSCAIGCGIATQASAGGPVGTSVSDTATVTGGFPTGTVTFRLFSNAACNRSLRLPQRPSPRNGDVRLLRPRRPRHLLLDGGLQRRWLQPAVTSPCGAPNESVTIGKVTPAITTQASLGGLVGTPVSDVAPSRAVQPDRHGHLPPVQRRRLQRAGVQLHQPLGTPLGVVRPGRRRHLPLDGHLQRRRQQQRRGTLQRSQRVGDPHPLRGAGLHPVHRGRLPGPGHGDQWESVCIRPNARVVGPVTVQAGGALSLLNNKTARGIIVDRPSFLSICGTEISAPDNGGHRPVGVQRRGPRPHR